MRQKINDNPVYQAAVIGLLLVAFAVVFMTQVAGRGSDEEASGDVATAPTEAAVPAEPTAAAPIAPDASGAGGTVAPDVAPGAPTGAFKAGPGLPREVVRAHEQGKTVVLLIRRSNGIDDRAMLRAVNRLDDPGVAVFTSRARSVERYSRITIGVDVTRVPALIVLRPKRFDVGGQPQASVTYGLRSQQAAEQQVRDAVYDGRENVPYHPG